VLLGFNSRLIDPANVALGIVDSSVNVNNGTLTCMFVRENFNSLSNYIGIVSNSRLYIMSAYGSGNVSFHGSNVAASNAPITFQINGTDNNTTTPMPNTVQNLITSFYKKVLAWILALFNF
jgi:hypothetical protein